MEKVISAFVILFLLSTVVPCIAQNNFSKDSIALKKLKGKITFDVEQLNEKGLLGSADGYYSIAYEFCIPVNKRKRKKVHRIDPSVQFQLGPKGRSNCQGKYLCIGSGGTKQVLLQLAKLNYILQINPCYWE